MPKLKAGFKLLTDLLNGFGSKEPVDINKLSFELMTNISFNNACKGVNRVMSDLSRYDSEQLMVFHGVVIDYLNSLINNQTESDYLSVVDDLIGQAQESFFGRRIFSLDQPKELLILCRDYLNQRLERSYEVEHPVDLSALKQRSV